MRTTILLGTTAVAALLLAGCVTRPVNPPLVQYDPTYGYRASNWQSERGDPEFGLVVAMSGGGTRAAAFSYGVLEELRRTMVPTATADARLPDNVKLVTGISGGSFTALAYALHGDRLFEGYERRFLKRDVQGDLIAGVVNPMSWPKTMGGTYTRTDLAADYYDEILFNGATFGDLRSRGGPFASVAATELDTGARIAFNQNAFDMICSDLSVVRIARTAAASSAAPGVSAPLVFDNYAESCNFGLRGYLARIFGEDVDPTALQDGVNHRYLHLIDGGLSDNVGLRTVLKALEVAAASQQFRTINGLDKLKRFAVIVVNSLADAESDWGSHEDAPNVVSLLIRAIGHRDYVVRLSGVA